MTQLASRAKELELSYGSAVVALHIAGWGNSVPDALSHFATEAAGGARFPGRELLGRFRAQVKVCCGKMDEDIIAGLTPGARRAGPVELGI